MVFKQQLVNHNKNNSVKCRNFTEPNDLHDTIKLLLVRMLRRKHPNNNIPIYTEFDPINPNDDYPDVWMRVKQDIYVYEIQNKITKAWTKRIMQQYEDVNLIIIDMSKAPNDIKGIKKYLEDFIY